LLPLLQGLTNRKCGIPHEKKQLEALFIPQLRHLLATYAARTPDPSCTMSTTTTVTQAEPITAQNILRLFPDIDTSSAALDGHDEEQIRLMDEVCIVLDENDKPIGNFSKKICMNLLADWTKT
jgi:hypothetical protein